MDVGRHSWSADAHVHECQTAMRGLNGYTGIAALDESGAENNQTSKPWLY